MNMENEYVSKKPTNLKGIGFFCFSNINRIILALGSKISEMLLDLIELDGLLFEEIQFAEQFFHYSVAATVLFWGILVDRNLVIENTF
jgi:hypothetical protein